MNSSEGNDSKPPLAAHHLFDRLKEKVLVKRPVLQKILAKRGQKNLLEYAHDYVDVNLNPPIQKRQNDMLETIFEAVEARFGKKTAWSVLRQLEKYYFVSTADHAGPLTHPFFVNSNLLTAASMLSRRQHVLQNIVVLACANISFNNSSFPRGILFHTSGKKGLQSHRLPFLSAKPKAQTIYRMPPYGAEEIKKTLEALKLKFSQGEVGPRENDLLRALVQDVYNQPEILACKSYAEQMSRTNFHLWKRFFGASNVKLPNLIHLEQEDIVVRLLSKYHLEKDTIINHILFDPAYEHYLTTYFEGIFGSFSRQASTGTYLFWALPEGQRDNLQLWRKGNYLVSKDESYKIELHPEVIKKAMESKELIPSLLLNFITLSFYYGLKCLGGFNQVNYLTLMKNSYIRMNVDLENYRSIEVCARAQTKEMCDGLTFAFLKDPQNGLALATGVDLILYGNKASWKDLISVAKNITFDEALSPLMPEIYRISYDESEWEPDLLTVQEKDINKMLNLEAKIKPCVTLA